MNNTHSIKNTSCVLAIAISLLSAGCGGGNASGPSNLTGKSNAEIVVNNFESTVSNQNSAQSTKSTPDARLQSLVASTTTIFQSSIACQIPDKELYALGTYESIEHTGTDLVLYGKSAYLVKEVYFKNNRCRLDSTRTSGKLQVYQCQVPGTASGEQSSYISQITFHDKSPWYKRPGYYSTSLQANRTYNGEFIFAGLRNYLLNQNADGSVDIDVNMKALSGNESDIPPWQYFKIRAQGSNGTFKCAATETPRRYTCTNLPNGVYFVDLLHDNDTRYIYGSLFAIKVVPTTEYLEIKYTPPPVVYPPPPELNSPSITTDNCINSISKECE